MFTQNMGTPKWMVYNYWKILLRWMIWGYPYFWKRPHIDILFVYFSESFLLLNFSCFFLFIAGLKIYDQGRPAVVVSFVAFE